MTQDLANKAEQAIIRGQGPTRAIKTSDIFDVTPEFFRLLVLLAFSAFGAIWTTGYLRPLLLGLFLPMLIMLYKGRGIFQFPRFVQIASLFVLFYSFQMYRSNLSGVVVLIEFTSLILFLQLQVLTDSLGAAGSIILALMIVLAVAAMNVNFLFPLSLLPFLFILFFILQKIVLLRHHKILAANPQASNDSGKFALSHFKKLVGVAVFFLLWATLFYLVPRSESYGMAAESSRRRLKGFNETLSLGEGGLLEDNPAVVMRVRPTDSASLSPSIVRRLRSKLLRGTSFASYYNGRWERNQTRRWYIDLRKTFGELVVMKSPGVEKLVHQIEIIQENTEPPVLFLPDQTVNAYIESTYLAVESDGSMFFLGKAQAKRRYLARLLINPLEIEDSLVSDLDLEGSSRVYLSRAGVDQKINLLAQQIASGARTINERVVATKKYLQTTCNYSLFEEHSAQVDPILHFLFSSRAGTCEHFASAMTLLLRCMGIPARPVNGYTMGDWNELGKFFTVRQRHAHTWVEVYFPNNGWVPFDPSPPAEVYEPESEVEKLFVWLWETYEGHWFNYVYSFDHKTQLLGFRRISAFLTRHLLRLKAVSWFGVFIFLVMILLLVLGYNTMRVRRVVKSSWIPEWYINWSEKLPEQRNAWETPKEFHLRLVDSSVFSPNAAEVLSEISLLVDRSALSGFDESQIRVQAEDLIKQLESLENRP